MRQHQDVGGEPRGLAKQVALRAADITQQEDTASPHLEAQGQRTLVARASPLELRRPEGLDPQIGHPMQGTAATSLEDGNARRGGRLADLPKARVLHGSTGNPDGARFHRREHGRNAAPVVHVGVGHDHEVELRNTQCPQRRNHDAGAAIEEVRDRATRIDEHCTATSLDQDGITAPDIEHHHPRRRGEQRRRRRQPEHHADGRRPDRGAERTLRPHAGQRQQARGEQREGSRGEVETLRCDAPELGADLQGARRQPFGPSEQDRRRLRGG